MAVETRQVHAGKDAILALVDRTSPVTILAELIWNALDAEACTVDVEVSLDAMGVPDEIVVRDDGHGMTHEEVGDLFLTYGESWKRTTGFSRNIKRPMHGRLGRGRFLVYGIADNVEWRSVAANGEAFTEAVVRGYRARPHEFSFDDPASSDGPAGTAVRMAMLQIPRVTRIGDGELHLPLTARLAATLLALKGVKVTYRGLPLDPQAHVIDDTFIDLEVDQALLHGKSQPRLRIVEWSSDMGSKALYLCDDRGGVVTEFKPTRIPPAPVHWTAYLLWEGFRDPELMGLPDLQAPDIRYSELLSHARRELVDYLNRRLDEQKGSILAEWKAEGVYPYAGEPRSVVEEVEREIFDIVAVVASPAISRDPKQKKLSLRLLQETTRAEPTRTNRILNAVLNLSEDEQEVLSDLLERTKLTSIVQAAQTIADRSDFLHALRGLLYANETRSMFREVDQLHPMLVVEPWVFGDEWNMALSESGLTRVVRTLITKNEGVEFAPQPVVLPSGKRGRVDMVFYRTLPESERTRHLVVELKRPKKLTMEEFSQVSNYASAITGHPEVVGAPHFWDFWLLGTEIDDTVRDLCNDLARPGLATNNPRYRVWIMTWGQLLDQADRRVQAFRAALELVSTDQTSRAYLQRKHAEFIPPLGTVDPSA